MIKKLIFLLFLFSSGCCSPSAIKKNIIPSNRLQIEIDAREHLLKKITDNETFIFSGIKETRAYLDNYPETSKKKKHELEVSIKSGYLLLPYFAKIKKDLQEELDNLKGEKLN